MGTRGPASAALLSRGGGRLLDVDAGLSGLEEMLAALDDRVAGADAFALVDNDGLAVDVGAERLRRGEHARAGHDATSRYLSASGTTTFAPDLHHTTRPRCPVGRRLAPNRWLTISAVMPRRSTIV
jgi:hypothetical protein